MSVSGTFLVVDRIIVHMIHKNPPSVLIKEYQIENWILKTQMCRHDFMHIFMHKFIRYHLITRSQRNSNMNFCRIIIVVCSQPEFRCGGYIHSCRRSSNVATIGKATFFLGGAIVQESRAIDAR